MRVRVLLLTALLALVLSCPAAVGASGRSGSAIGARPATNYCQRTLHFGEEPYGVIGHGVSCAFAVRWTKRYQRHGLHPRHWTCVGREEFTEGGSCQDRRDERSFEYYIED